VGNEDAPKPNRQLRAHMDRKGLGAEGLADLIAVDAKTVERWLSGERAPYPQNARRAAEVLDCDPADLWPDLFPIMTPPSGGTVAVSVYSSRADVPPSVWRQLFEDAAEHIDILVYGGTFLFDGLPRFTKILAAATDRGVAVRFVIGDPDSPAVAQRGQEEGIRAALAARCQMTLTRLQPLSGTSGLEIRTHTTPLYTSMFRADDTLIANPHLYGAPASDNPAIVIKRGDAPDLWDDHRLAFERVWKTARPIQAHT
jgi:lambda repressor-like predicted transcriptional regulator